MFTNSFCAEPIPEFLHRNSTHWGKIMANGNVALVLGATGGIGGEVARQLRDAGWAVLALKRGLQQPMEQRDGMLWMRGDAMNRDDVMHAARGCSVIVHAVNPPGYRKWSELVLPMLDNTVAAAIAERATIVLPGTIYNYGPDVFPLLAEDAPQRPPTRKGAIRVELERRLQAATSRGARVVIVRAGDFFGPRVGNSWFWQGLIKPGQPVTTVNLPGDRDVGHQWSYLPDVARTMVELLARRERLEPFAAFHMAGHWDADGTQMAAAIQRVVERRSGSRPKVRAFAWWLVRLASPFVATLRELLEMRYLWRQPVRMSNARLTAVLGREPHTPLDDAVEATLTGLGCLATPAAAAPACRTTPANHRLRKSLGSLPVQPVNACRKFAASL
jgi:nucleoside-diphosphate-sugar epimerase